MKIGAGPWLRLCEGMEWGPCWDRAIKLARESPSRDLKVTVLREGQMP